MRRLMAMLAGTLVVVLAAQVAFAGEIHDPRDTGGKLDIESVDASRNGKALEVAVTMYNTWPSTVLKHRGKNRIKILFDTDNDGKAEYVGSIFDLKGTLEMVIRGQGSTFEPLSVSRPDDFTALVKVPGGSPPNPATKYQVAAKTIFVPSSGPTKIDRAPDSGWIAVPHA